MSKEQPQKPTASELEILRVLWEDRKSTRLNSSHRTISYAVFCLKKKKKKHNYVSKNRKIQHHLDIVLIDTLSPACHTEFLISTSIHDSLGIFVVDLQSLAPMSVL